MDRASGGHADKLRRIGTYLCFGACAALVNLLTQALLLYHAHLPIGESTRNLVALLVANEVSIVVNFVLNDRYTFAHLAGAQRAWQVRCARFHLTALTGSVLAILLQIVLHEALHLQPVLANGAAIGVVLCFNFTAHHLFTYRHSLARPALGQGALRALDRAAAS